MTPTDEVKEEPAPRKALDLHPVIHAARRVVTQQIRDSYELAESSIATLSGLPASGSGRARLNEWLDGLPTKTKSDRRFVEASHAVLQLAVENIHHLTLSARDHACALEVAFRDERGLTTSLDTLVRGCLEAILQICFVMEPLVPPSTTLLRACAFQLAAAEGAEVIAASFARVTSGEERVVKARAAVDGMHDWLERGGFERGEAIKNPRRSANIGYAGERVSLEFDATGATKRYLPDTDFIYGVLSGAAHSRGWFLGSVYGIDDEGAFISPLPDSYQACALSFLALADAFTKTFCGHFGLDADPYLKATHTRRRMLVRIADPSRGDFAADHASYHAPRRSRVVASYTAAFDPNRPTGSS